MEGESEFVLVGVPRPLREAFLYRVPEPWRSQVTRGAFVKVPFGKKTVLQGVVLAFAEKAEAERVGVDRIKDLLEVRSFPECLSEEILALCQWVSEYYLTFLGEVCGIAAPSLERPKRARSQQKKEETSQSLPSQILKKLTEDQSRVLKEIRQSLPLGGKGFGVGLLRGVTGSGKTEVYLELIREVLQEQQGGVLLLVPEIALTPQLHRRIEEGLGVSVGLWHSVLSPIQRGRVFDQLQTGVCRVLLGARSAVFAPMPHLRWVILDEEHEASYKQEERARYHAREVAMIRAQRAGACVLLGSATPSLETQERVLEKKFQSFFLPKKAVSTYENTVHLVDLLIEPRIKGTQTLLAKSFMKALQETLQRGEQALLYLNKKGYASFLLCQDCGHVPECEHCTVSLTFYRRAKKLQCSVCGFSQEVFESCPKCQGRDWAGKGVGTEGLEEDLRRLLPGVSLARLDRDQVTSVTRLEDLLNKFQTGQTQLLLGTQLLVKGHDFPGVTFVGVILADQLFYWPDFRATERAYQVLKQVSGRAGRGERPGALWVQTFHPEHPVLKVLQGKQSEDSFWEQERQLRKTLGYPPFVRLARIRVLSSQFNDAKNHSFELSQRLSSWKASEVQVLGPSPAFLEKAFQVYRWDLWVKSPRIGPFQELLRRAQYFVDQANWVSTKVEWEVDPYQS